MNFTPVLSWAGSSSTLTTDVQFRWGTLENLQIEGVGLTATIKLLNVWTHLPTNSTPTARRYSPLTYDKKNKKIILFGGYTGSNTYLYDTWIFDPVNNQWQEKTYAVHPSSRAEHILVYLSDGKTILFGGKDDKDTFFNDTWIYDFNSGWSKKSYNLALSSRAAASAVAISSNSLILFGGRDAQGQRLNDLWRYDLAQDSWTKLNPLNPPSGRDSAGIAYDPQKNKIVLFGGYNGSQNLNDTWVYDLDKYLGKEN